MVLGTLLRAALLEQQWDQMNPEVPSLLSHSLILSSTSNVWGHTLLINTHIQLHSTGGTSAASLVHFQHFFPGIY